MNVSNFNRYLLVDSTYVNIFSFFVKKIMKILCNLNLSTYLWSIILILIIIVMKQSNIYLRIFAFIAFVVCCSSVNAQIKYDSNGKLTFGNTTPFGFYDITLNANGMYLKCKNSNFFQIDVSPDGGTRLASHGNDVVFYNTQSGNYNSIQVQSVYNASDVRLKTNIKPLNNCLPLLMKLKTYSYNFKNNGPSTRSAVSNTQSSEYGLLAQDVEKVLPNLVITDSNGVKLLNYTELVPMLINAVQTLSKRVEALEAAKKR